MAKESIFHSYIVLLLLHQ